jgi:hypothetical protein
MMSDVDKPVTGLVISYSYLWVRQHDAGEESGRKARPVCVALPVGAGSGDVALFPLTTQPPAADRVAIEVPETELRRLGLRSQKRCWIILDEGNRDILPGSVYLEPLELRPAKYAYGVLSHAFTGQILRALAETIRAKKVRTIPRA